jgi:hypothetical protein
MYAKALRLREIRLRFIAVSQFGRCQLSWRPSPYPSPVGRGNDSLGGGYYLVQSCSRDGVGDVEQFKLILKHKHREKAQAGKLGLKLRGGICCIGN